MESLKLVSDALPRTGRTHSVSQVCKKLQTAGAALPVEFAVLPDIKDGKVPTKKELFCCGTPETEKLAMVGKRFDESIFKVPLASVS
jgi:hypothetical protein